jgi:HK97 family phage portal protein
MADRSLVAMMAAGLGSMVRKSPVEPTTFRGPLSELSGVGIVREPFAGAWQRNITESGPNLLTFSPIFACVTRISNDIAKLALLLLAEIDEGTEVFERAPKGSPYWIPLRKPNAYQTRIQFIRHWLLSKLLHGNAYILKVRDGRGIVAAMYVLDPRKVLPLVTPDGAVYYQIGSDYLTRVPTGIAAAPATEIIHDRGATLWHPLVGIAPLYAAALSGALGLRIQRNSAAFFENMSRPSGVLTAPKTITEPTAERLKKDWKEHFSGTKIGGLAVLGDGMKYEPMAVVAEQAQLAEQFEMSAMDVATAFAMPPYKIGHGPMPTNNNVQALNLQYHADCLQTYIEDIEALLDEGVEVPDRYGIEFDLDGLLRMDSLTQMDVLSKGVGGTILSPNEARQRLNRRPKRGGDSLFIQQQNYSVEAIAKRDEKPDPFKAASPPPAPAAAPMPEPGGVPAAGAPAPKPTPAPAPQESRAVELLLTRALEEVRTAGERAAAAEQLRGAAEAAAAASREAAEAAQQREAAAAERARAAEERIQASAIDPEAFCDELADALLKRFEIPEPANG